ncbi:helix-turn-helix transcriptional regulator [Paenibacillus segetis]|jgi:AraC-like DNA-binding protein|uniref:HTH-type transcriptional regulator YisR n=1 Tax=Paenibacillus segetis TaxID=1325360 RepID=A0ABQ1YW36_9BACL|nr:AraC family transcriptional regulator [Paenibacillus segetis]GGH38221.1 putative HTH-type transcriptional regulator YisR [Paenibacillus segetis]
MPIIEFTAPPLPHYIISGLSHAEIGGKHPSRQNIGAFDLLVVVQGCLFLRESGHDYEIKEGHALILRPDSQHYAYAGCLEETTHYWLHFQILGDWRVIDEESYYHSQWKSVSEDRPRHLSLPPFSTTSYNVALPQFTKLAQPLKMGEIINELTQMNQNIHLASVRLKQQALFQEVIVLLSSSLGTSGPSSQTVCAERAASYLREHYRDGFSAKQLGESINFHPVYIARCMQKVYGCSPSVYLINLRIEQSKILLLQTDLPVERIAEEVGFNHAAYFTSCFTKIEGLSPRKYRQRFAWDKE